MDVRYAANPRDVRGWDTRRLREEFLIDTLFQAGKVVWVYAHTDRMIAGSACPEGEALPLPAELPGVEFFLEEREMAVLNLGDGGEVMTDGKVWDLGRNDALYIGKGTRAVTFQGSGAKFYFISCPAHRVCPVTRIPLSSAVAVRAGSAKEANARTIHKYLDPSVAETCQLAMGLTVLEEGSIWNTMPAHTHERRMEVYLYWDLPEDGFVVHLAGEPKETRHLIVRNGQAVISPPWSIHSGAGTCAYAFVWGMCGENRTYGDMDAVGMSDLM